MQKTLALAVALMGTYGNVPLPAQARAFLPESTARQAGIQLAQIGQEPDRGAPDPSTRRGAGTFARGTTIFQTPEPPDRGAPGTREGAATRGQCPKVDPRVGKSLTALVPSVEGTSGEGQSLTVARNPRESVWGLTASERPTFWFYVPFSLTARFPIEFVLQDEKGNDVYKTDIAESGTSPGVVSFQLPSSAPPLELGKMYRWYFLIYCNNSEEHIFVNGWVQRVALNPSLKSQLEQATPEAKVALYGKAGLWFDTVTSLAALRRQHPEDAKLRNDWTLLLRDIGLSAIAQEPITSVLAVKK